MSTFEERLRQAAEPVKAQLEAGRLESEPKKANDLNHPELEKLCAQMVALAIRVREHVTRKLFPIVRQDYFPGAVIDEPPSKMVVSSTLVVPGPNGPRGRISVNLVANEAIVAATIESRRSDGRGLFIDTAGFPSSTVTEQMVVDWVEQALTNCVVKSLQGLNR